jgi:hypothetical protein
VATSGVGQWCATIKVRSHNFTISSQQCAPHGGCAAKPMLASCKTLASHRPCATKASDAVIIRLGPSWSAHKRYVHDKSVAAVVRLAD